MTATPHQPLDRLRESVIKIVDPMVYADGTVYKDDTRVDQLLHLIADYLAALPLPEKHDSKGHPMSSIASARYHGRNKAIGEIEATLATEIAALRGGKDE